MTTPEAFLAAWGHEVPLSRYGRESLELLPISQDDKDFLAEAGLPESAAPFLNFHAPDHGELPTVAAQWDLPDDFHRYREIGSDGEGSPIAIDEERNGAVVLLDHDDEFSAVFMNSSVRQLAESLLALRNVIRAEIAARGESAYLDGLTTKARKQLHQQLKSIDPAAVRPASFWPNETLITEAPSDFPADALRDLASPDSAVRLKASKKLESELRKARSDQRRSQFGNQDVTSAFIAALEDSDPQVVHNSVVALSQISAHYHKDDRAYSRLLELTHSTHPLTARWAISAVIHLRGEASFDDVLPLCTDSSQEARSMTLSHLYSWLLHYGKKEGVAPESEARVRDAAVRALEDEDATVRGYAADLLTLVGDSGSLPPLQKCMKSEKHWLAKQSMEKAVKAIRSRP